MLAARAVSKLLHARQAALCRVARRRGPFSFMRNDRSARRSPALSGPRFALMSPASTASAPSARLTRFPHTHLPNLSSSLARAPARAHAEPRTPRPFSLNPAFSCGSRINVIEHRTPLWAGGVRRRESEKRAARARSGLGFERDSVALRERERERGRQGERERDTLDHWRRCERARRR